MMFKCHIAKKREANSLSFCLSTGIIATLTDIKFRSVNAFCPTVFSSSIFRDKDFACSAESQPALRVPLPNLTCVLTYPYEK